jgi:parvulin-like peptidyl-prolyl isomerase
MKLRKCFISLAFAASLMAQAPVAPSQVVATVDGKDVTRADIEKIKNTAPGQLVQMFQTDPRAALSTWFVMQHLGQEGLKRKLEQQSPLKEQIEAIVFDVVARAVVNDEQNRYAVTNERIQAFYEANQPRYEQTKIKGIFVSFKPQIATTGDIQTLAQQALANANNQRSETEARTLAAAIVKQLREGADFAKLVEQNSDDSVSKAQGGDLPVIKIGSLHPQDFRKAVAVLKPGEVSDPIRQASGFYIVRVEERSLQPLAEVRGDIIDEIRKEHLNEWLQEINRRFSVTVKDPSFFMQPGQPPVGFRPPGQ